MGIFEFLGDERSAEESAAMRAEAARRFNIEAFTCDNCPAAKTCQWAFDAYNTDGDCLAEK